MLVGLDAQDEPIGVELLDRRFVKKRERRALETNGDFGGARHQPLASPQIERHPRPAPIVDEQTHRDIGFDLQIGRDVLSWR